MSTRTSLAFIGLLALSLTFLAGCASSTGATAGGAPQARTLSGAVSYAGAKPSHQVVIVVTRVGEQQPAYSTVVKQLGPYTIGNVADATYVITAFMDMGDDMGPPGATEPMGTVDKDGDGKTDEIVVKDGKGLGGLDIVLRDPK